ncbi:26S protease regulatory subunit 6B like [Apostasia shenzhenica]|uniref:26S protease regulatory subunit 6B like n=1 Tax=Apostasia shenzhenica TaxID=1088818 RepID=A0A2I0B8S9_9ASPA|nr:26S protease regulatory subunit 6B like [Apostasia shenzhenica]
MASLLSAVIGMAGGLLLLRTVLSLKSLLYLIGRCWRWLEERTQAYQSFKVPRSGESTSENPLYRKAAAYVSSLPTVEDSDHTALFSSGVRTNDFFAQLDAGQIVHDSFLGARLTWTFVPSADGEPCLVLRLRRQDRHRVLRPYLQHVETVAEEIELRRKEIRLYTNAAGDDRRRWRSAPMTHPSTLETLAIDPDLKTRVKVDLESFLKGRNYYLRLGRVWKRSYLLYGPPGTGKSSFVAAMARLLCYDVYDLDLSRVSDGADLRSLLLDTTPRSLILVEDLDRYLAGGGVEAASRLSAMLNFMDGIFSCCGEERVMVFTASGGKESLDPAVLRPGRLDVQIHFPLCDFSAFKTLASSYLGLKDHKLYPQVEEGFQNGAKLSPAEIGEIMIAHRGSPSRALKSVINALHRSASFGSPVDKTISPSFSACNRRSPEAEEAGCAVGGIGFGREATVRELRKLYGFIRMRSGSKKERLMPVEAAGDAAAAAANHSAEW